ncbi:MAG TPA: alpha/beta fold hydrolase [Candidatus Acidoferrum sp.]|nr:alpha/beta fold hydrolase [Candidatus Acidoferrum sp.]
MPSRPRAAIRFGLIATLAATVVAGPAALAYRFAVVYRTRAGFPRRRPPVITPADRGLPFMETVVHGASGDLPAWFIPARDGLPGPGVLLVHGWESGRDRTLPNAQVLHAAGFHVLSFDVRGHGANAAETLPISVAEFGADALAGFETLVDRPEVTSGAILGHSLGAVGAIIAAAELGARCAALVSTSAPADPRRLTRQTFRMAHLPIPEPIATPLAAFTTRMYLRPRGHAVGDLSASREIGLYAGPTLLVHGALDSVLPVSHLARLERAARAGQERRIAAGQPAGGPIETLIVPEGRHSWLFEHEIYRRTVATFLATALGGPFGPAEAADRAAAVDALRVPDPDESFAAVTAASDGRRTLAEIVGATRPTTIEETTVAGSGGATEPAREIGEPARESEAVSRR